MKRLIAKADHYYNTRQIVTKNKRLFDEGKIDKCVSFEYNGYKIFDPFKNENGDEDVDPKEYYGKAFEDSKFNCMN